jgi:hypothetical protein
MSYHQQDVLLARRNAAWTAVNRPYERRMQLPHAEVA